MQNIFPVMILLSIIGFLLILIAFLNKQLLQWIGLKPMSELFTNPNFQRSAKTTEVLGQLLLLVMGAGFLLQGAGSLFLSSKVIYIISLILLGLLGLIIVVVFGVILANWKAK